MRRRKRPLTGKWARKTSNYDKIIKGQTDYTRGDEHIAFSETLSHSDRAKLKHALMSSRSINNDNNSSSTIRRQRPTSAPIRNQRLRQQVSRYAAARKKTDRFSEFVPSRGYVREGSHEARIQLAAKEALEATTNTNTTLPLKALVFDGPQQNKPRPLPQYMRPTSASSAKRLHGRTAWVEETKDKEEEEKQEENKENQQQSHNDADEYYKADFDVDDLRVSLQGALQDDKTVQKLFRSVRATCRKKFGLTHAAFQFIDRKTAGRLSYEECRTGFQRLGVPITTLEVNIIISLMDVSNSGFVDFRTLRKAVQISHNRRLLGDFLSGLHVGVDGRQASIMQQTVPSLYHVDPELQPSVPEGAQRFLEQRTMVVELEPRQKKQQHLNSSPYLFKPLPSTKQWKNANEARFDRSEEALRRCYTNDGAVKAERYRQRLARVQRNKERVEGVSSDPRSKTGVWEEAEKQALSKRRQKHAWMVQVKGADHDKDWMILRDNAFKGMTYRYKKTHKHVAIPQW